MEHKWILWYHDPNNMDYSLESYIQVATVSTVEEFWSLINGIPPETMNTGMFFFMREGYRPMWEAEENAKGGAWSMKIDAQETSTIFIDCMVHCLAQKFLSSHAETIVGVNVSPKGQFHIIKIWNTTTTVSDKKLFSPSLKLKKSDIDIVYKAHQGRPM